MSESQKSCPQLNQGKQFTHTHMWCRIKDDHILRNLDPFDRMQDHVGGTDRQLIYIIYIYTWIIISSKTYFAGNLKGLSKCCFGCLFSQVWPSRLRTAHVRLPFLTQRMLLLLGMGQCIIGPSFGKELTWEDPFAPCGADALLVDAEARDICQSCWRLWKF